MRHSSECCTLATFSKTSASGATGDDMTISAACTVNHVLGSLPRFVDANEKPWHGHDMCQTSHRRCGCSNLWIHFSGLPMSSQKSVASGWLRAKTSSLAWSVSMPKTMSYPAAPRDAPPPPQNQSPIRRRRVSGRASRGCAFATLSHLWSLARGLGAASAGVLRAGRSGCCPTFSAAVLGSALTVGVHMVGVWTLPSLSLHGASPWSPPIWCGSVSIAFGGGAFWPWSGT